MRSFLRGLFLLCAGTLMYEVTLTRVLSVVSWYYLAFVTISMAMFGMTAGALAVQLRPDFFAESAVSRRLAQSAFAMAVSIPLVLMSIYAVPIDISLALQTLYSFVLFATIVAIPFFFSGIAVCLSLTRSPYAIGRVYFADLLGAAAGCLGSVVLLRVLDGSSAILAISAVLFLSAAEYSNYANDRRRRRNSLVGVTVMVPVALLNASTLHGIQPIWIKGTIDHRTHILTENWTPSSKVRAMDPLMTNPLMWGPSPKMPHIQREQVHLDIDGIAGTAIGHFKGDLSQFEYLNYDVTTLGAQLRKGGTATVIGVGGGRDVLAFAVNGFKRIVGVEINNAILSLCTQRLRWFSGFDKISGLELHYDEGRSYLARSKEKFDVIQASLVDTWAATSAGAMTLTENSLYTVDAWRIYYEHLRPGGFVTFTRWFVGHGRVETTRLFSLAWATLIIEGVSSPGSQIALVQGGDVATILVSNQPLSVPDLAQLQALTERLGFKPLYLPYQNSPVPEINEITLCRSVTQMAHLGDRGLFDYSPTFDTSPYFFNSMRLKMLLHFEEYWQEPNLRALLFVFLFTFAATILVILAILLPLANWSRAHVTAGRPRPGSLLYFIGIGLAFMMAEMAMMQQMSVFLGLPIYAMIIVLAGLILSAGLGSLFSDRLRLSSNLISRVPAIASAGVLLIYSSSAAPMIHRFVAGSLGIRAFVSLALVVPCGFFMGFCFPIGLRWMSQMGQKSTLPWMWALNGAAGTLAAFIALTVSMQFSIRTAILCSAVLYLLCGVLMPAKKPLVKRTKAQIIS